MSILSKKPNDYKLSSLTSLTDDLKSYIEESAKAGKPIHEVEKNIFQQVLSIGANALGYFIHSQGDGDIGDIMTSGTGNIYNRLKNRVRGYQSIFGKYQIERAVYGTHESKKIECVPLDARLELPEHEHSYLLQEWSQMISTEVPFKVAMDMLKEILPISMSVDTIEQTNRHMGSHAATYQESLTAEQSSHLKELNDIEKAALKKSILVISADGKGVPIRQTHDKVQAAEALQVKKKGPKPDRKKMAVVGSVYTVQPYKRTPEQIVEALFRDAQAPDPIKKAKRPEVSNKSVIANLTRSSNGQEINATTSTFDWLKKQINLFSPHIKSRPVMLMDGQISLWNEAERQLPDKKYTEILDLLHAISRLWDITNVFYDSKDNKKWSFIRERVLRMLQGGIKGVVSGARQMATKRNISKSKIKKLDEACNYLLKNQHRMKYDEYLACGMPIASGVIEGACRHFVKDRMERSGMQWTIEGAQSMLDVRAIRLNGSWTKFVKFRIGKETEKNYPNKKIFKQIDWPMAA